ncbi:hypothetical protein [Actibacterium sp. D379-3]
MKLGKLLRQLNPNKTRGNAAFEARMAALGRSNKQAPKAACAGRVFKNPRAPQAD